MKWALGLAGLLVVLGLGAFYLSPALSPAGDGQLISQSALLALAERKQQTEFNHVRDNPPVAGVRRQVVSFANDNLRQYALILWPTGQVPVAGWPVLLFNHGYHPDPPNYGRIADGSSNRPGDYYRGIPLIFARNGFVVVTPDYRGHNDSEGSEYTGGMLAAHWYARDVIAAFRAVSTLDGVNLSQAFMLGHSMGGGVTQQVLLALGDKIKAASIWSTASQPGWLQSLVELRYAGLWSVKRMAALQVPLLLQHARDDQTTPMANSEQVVAVVAAAGKPVKLFRYDSADHLLAGEDFDLAVQRDLAWFAANSQQ